MLLEHVYKERKKSFKMQMVQEMKRVEELLFPIHAHLPHPSIFKFFRPLIHPPLMQAGVSLIFARTNTFKAGLPMFQIPFSK